MQQQWSSFRKERKRRLQLNHNFNEAPHSGQNGNHWKIYKQQTLERVGRSEHPPALVLGRQSGRASMETVCARAESLQSCSTLFDPVDCNIPGFSVHRILQTHSLERAAFPPPGDLPDPGIEPASLMFPTLAGGVFTIGTTWEAP